MRTLTRTLTAGAFATLVAALSAAADPATKVTLPDAEYKHLVAAHNGSTRVESRLQEGTTFFFTLPLDEATLRRQQLNPEFTAS